MRFHATAFIYTEIQQKRNKSIKMLQITHKDKTSLACGTDLRTYEVNLICSLMQSKKSCVILWREVNIKLL